VFPVDGCTVVLAWIGSVGSAERCAPVSDICSFDIAGGGETISAEGGIP